MIELPNKAVQRVTITTLEAGQPRPYADSRYRYRVEIEYQPPLLGEPRTVRWKGKTLLSAACQAVGYKWPQGPHAWHESYVKEAVELEPGVAEVLVVHPFLD